MKGLIDTAHISKKGDSLKISIPKKVANIIGAKEESVLGFFVDGECVFIRTMK